MSPYVEAEFFTRIVSEMRPKDLHVVIDDGCRREDRETVLRAVEKGGHKRSVFLKLGSTRGLVHLKLFYTRWRTKGGQTAHSLVFGSANATRQGFSGIDNGELIACCPLTATSHGKVLAWCEQVIEATCASQERAIPAARDAMLAPGIKLRLPAITVGREVAAVSNFDLWIQRGYLLSSYRPDPSFLSVNVALSKALPQGEQERLASGAGFETPKTRSVRHRYIDDGSSDETDGTEPQVGNWRSRLFTLTQLGEWCSDGAYQAHGSEFRRRNHDKREAALSELEKLGASPVRNAARSAFLAKMEALWNALGDEAPEFLRGKSEIERQHYRDVFDERIDRDLALAADEEFQHRYVAGFEFVAVPRFRNDVAGWHGFMDSLGRQLILDGMKKRPRSRLLGAVREVADRYDSEGNALEDAAALIAFLRTIWGSDVVSKGAPTAMIANYHEK